MKQNSMLSLGLPSKLEKMFLHKIRANLWMLVTNEVHAENCRVECFEPLVASTS